MIREDTGGGFTYVRLRTRGIHNIIYNWCAACHLVLQEECQFHFETLDLGPHCSFWILVLTAAGAMSSSWAGFTTVCGLEFGYEHVPGAAVGRSAPGFVSHSQRWSMRAWRSVSTFRCGAQLCRLLLHTLPPLSHARLQEVQTLVLRATRFGIGVRRIARPSSRMPIHICHLGTAQTPAQIPPVTLRRGAFPWTILRARNPGLFTSSFRLCVNSDVECGRFQAATFTMAIPGLERIRRTWSSWLSPLRVSSVVSGWVQEMSSGKTTRCMPAGHRSKVRRNAHAAESVSKFLTITSWNQSTSSTGRTLSMILLKVSLPGPSRSSL